MKTVKKTTESRINCNFFFTRKLKDRISITMATASKVSSYASLLHLHNICIIAKKRNFNLSYRVLRSQNRLNTHYS